MIFGGSTSLKKKQMIEIVCKEIEDNAAFSDYDDFHNSSSLAELKSDRAIQYNCESIRKHF